MITAKAISVRSNIAQLKSSMNHEGVLLCPAMDFEPLKTRRKQVNDEATRSVEEDVLLTKLDCQLGQDTRVSSSMTVFKSAGYRKP